MKMIILWLCVMGAAMLIEMLTSTYVTMWFAIGAVFATIVAALGLEWYFQVPVFLISAFICLFVIREPFVSFMENGKFEFRTPEEKVLGKQAVLTEDLGEETGHVFLDGKLMEAKTAEDAFPLSKGTVVEVTGVLEGVLLVEEATQVKEDHSLTKSAMKRKKRQNHNRMGEVEL